MSGDSTNLAATHTATAHKLAIDGKLRTQLVDMRLNSNISEKKKEGYMSNTTPARSC